MVEFTDKTPLTADEITFQSLALAYAALHINQPAVTEALLFVLLEKLETTYELLTEVDNKSVPSAYPEVNYA